MHPDSANYQFQYDDINRLILADYTPNDLYNTNYIYDYNGNITSITRQGMLQDETNGTVDDFIMTYDGNQLLSTNDDNSSLGGDSASDLLFHQALAYLGQPISIFRLWFCSTLKSKNKVCFNSSITKH